MSTLRLIATRAASQTCGEDAASSEQCLHRSESVPGGELLSRGLIGHGDAPSQRLGKAPK